MSIKRVAVTCAFVVAAGLAAAPIATADPTPPNPYNDLRNATGPAVVSPDNGQHPMLAPGGIEGFNQVAQDAQSAMNDLQNQPPSP